MSIRQETARNIMRSLEFAAVKGVLYATRGNVSAAAVELEMAPRTLHRKINSLGLRDWLTSTYTRSDRQPQHRKKSTRA